MSIFKRKKKEPKTSDVDWLEPPVRGTGERIVCYHNWSNWSQQYTVQSNGEFREAVQSCVCKNCGMIATRLVWRGAVPEDYDYPDLDRL